MTEPNIVESPEEVLSTMTKDGARKWLYPVLSKGPWFWKRLVVGWGLIALFVALPIVEINDKPAVLLDVLKGEFTIIGHTFYATDTQWLMLLGIGILVSVVLFTALFGRVWCGWGCPQTVYLEFVFRPIELLIEGKASARRKLDRADWTAGKVFRKGLKWAAFILVSLLLAHVFVSYFAGWDRLLRYMSGHPAEHPGYFGLMAFTTALVLFDFAYFREQMCTIACPYARIQSVLLDRDSLIVTYDTDRGEPRGKVGKVEGDCIDCRACVRTCPTGIDIREGLQMECINCTQCIDACDQIMIRLDRPVGLVRYSSLNTIETEPTKKTEKTKPKVLRPRIILYFVVLGLIISAFVYSFVGAAPFDVGVVKAARMPFVVDGENVLNLLRVRVQNRTEKTALVRVLADASDIETTTTPKGTLAIEPGKSIRVETRVSAPETSFTNGHRDIELVIVSEDGERVTYDYTLIGPK